MNSQYVFYKKIDHDGYLYYMWPEFIFEKSYTTGKLVPYCFGFRSESFESPANKPYNNKMFLHRFVRYYSTDVHEKDLTIFLTNMDKYKHIHDIDQDILPHNSLFYYFLVKNVDLFFNKNKRGMSLAMNNFQEILLPQMDIKYL